MNLFKTILGFFKSLFGGKKPQQEEQENTQTVPPTSSTVGDPECEDCSDRDICQTTDKNKKYALIVGMETSRKFGGCPGAGKDSNTMLGLISKYVDSSHIVKMNSSQATISNFVNALNSQIEKVPEDGLMILAYSGHGGQYSNQTSGLNETDGKDEFLCLDDGPLVDDKLWEMMGKCKGRVLCFYDCCHSGTMYRTAQSDGESTEEAREPLQKPFFSKYENVRTAVRMLVYSGCGEETVSWGDSRNGGIMTSSLNRAFNKCLNYKEWWNRFRADASFSRVKQVPICTKIGAFDLNAKIFN